MADGIVTNGVSFAYRRGPPVLHDVSIALARGSFTALMGPNGCGKSTLLRIVAGLLRPDRGSVAVAGRDVLAVAPRVRAATIGYLPQNEPWEIPYTVRELVLMGRYPLQGAYPFDRAADVAAADAALAAVGASAYADRRLADLSGGERQRAALARVIAPEPAVLLLDEPAANLDARHQVDAYELVRGIQARDGRTVLLVSHDFNLPAAYADRVLLMQEGRIVCDGPPSEVLRARVLTPVYGVEFHEARADGLAHPVLVPRA